jgi:hypothetical protein
MLPVVTDIARMYRDKLGVRDPITQQAVDHVTNMTALLGVPLPSSLPIGRSHYFYKSFSLMNIVMMGGGAG